MPLSTRIRCAVAALPFEFPKLAVTAFVPEGGTFAMQIERRLRRIQEMKVIEAKPVEKVDEGSSNKVTDLSMPPPIPDRRFRRRV